jgi:hypothetical protein
MEGGIRLQSIESPEIIMMIIPPNTSESHGGKSILGHPNKVGGLAKKENLIDKAVWRSDKTRQITIWVLLHALDRKTYQGTFLNFVYSPLSHVLRHRHRLLDSMLAGLRRVANYRLRYTHFQYPTFGTYKHYYGNHACWKRYVRW